jgi:membrane protein DedA with SNARE-associated domain
MSPRLRIPYRSRLAAVAGVAVVLSAGTWAWAAGPTSGPAAVTATWNVLPDAERLQAMPAVLQILALVAGTLISEDLVCVLVGVMIRKGQIDWWVGGFGCFLGIYVGDLLFFALGRLGGARLLKVKWFSRGFGPDRLAAFGAWFDRRPWAAIAMCRVMPGIRVPLYLAVGALTTRTAAFFAWTCFFAFVWTPALIALVALLGDAFVRPFEWVTGGRGWLSILLGALTLYLVLRLVLTMSTPQGRRDLATKLRLPGSRASAERRSARDAARQPDRPLPDSPERRPADARETGVAERS